MLVLWAHITALYTRRMSLEKHLIQSALHQSWSADTSYVPKLWTPDNPAQGQCTPSSLVVRELLGGDILYRATTLHGSRERHYLDILPDGTEFDTTREQYPENQIFIDLPNRLKGFDSLADKLKSSPNNTRRFLALYARVLTIISDSQ